MFPHARLRDGPHAPKMARCDSGGYLHGSAYGGSVASLAGAQKEEDAKVAPGEATELGKGIESRWWLQRLWESGAGQVIRYRSSVKSFPFDKRACFFPEFLSCCYQSVCCFSSLVQVQLCKISCP